MGFLWFGRKEEIEIMDDIELYEDKTRKTALKRMAVESVIGMIARTIIQSEFRTKKNQKFVKEDIYYKLNIQPNINQSAARFWEQVIHKLIYDGDCLVIVTDTGDLLIADSFTKTEYAVFQDTFSDVIVKGYEFKRTFGRDEVLYFQYGNKKLSRLIDSLYYDYGELLGRLIEFQLRKNQIRATVDIDGVFSKTEGATQKLQDFINKTYNAILNKSVALFPQQKGLEYQEHQKAASSGQNVDEINKIANGFLDQVCNAVGVPPSLLKGDLADVEKLTRNYMIFCINPILEIIGDELNAQLVDKFEYLKGNDISIRRVRYRDLFDIATSIDKLIASGAFNGNEMRDEAGYEQTDEEIHKKYFITKNYQESSEALKGGEE